MFLGLRMNKGVSKQRFNEKFDQPIEQVYGQTIKDLISKDLLFEKDGYIAMTERGKVIGNTVLSLFIKCIKNNALTLTYFDQFDKL